MCISDVETGFTHHRILDYGVYEPTKASFSPDGERVLIITERKLSIRDVSTTEDGNGDAEPIKLSPSNFTAATFSPDGQRIVAGTDGGELSMWELHKSHDKPSKTVKLGAKIELIKFSTRGDILNIATSEKCFQCILQQLTNI